MDIGVASLAWRRASEKGIGGKYPFVECGMDSGVVFNSAGLEG